MADLTSDDEARLRRSIASFRMPSFTESSDDSFRLPSLAPESVSSHEESKEELASMTSLHESQIINIDDKYAQPINLSMEDSRSFIWGLMSTDTFLRRIRNTVTRARRMRTPMNLATIG